MNDIPKRQNEARSLAKLVAMRRTYSSGKHLLAWTIGLATVVPVSLAIAASKVDSLKPFAGAWCLVITFVAIGLERRERVLCARAARIQETFDCYVLDLDWNDTIEEPDPEDVAIESSGLDARARAALENWYPPRAGELPLAYARSICQRCNCAWERRLRNRYADLLWGALAVLTGLVIVVGIKSARSFTDVLLTVLVPILPIAVLLVRHALEQREAGRTSEQCAAAALGLYKDLLASTLDPKTIAARARTVQDRIYERRRTAPLVFDWFYRRLRSRQEMAMNQSADEMVDEVLATLNERALRAAETPSPESNTAASS
jgi:SMODS-associating 4TM effector domain